MKMNEPVTHYAPASRSSVEEITGDFTRFSSEAFFAQAIDFIPNVVLILNENRQAVFANQGLLDFLGIENRESVLGKRLGEILHCRHADETNSGCGTSEACCYCGAVNAILKSQEGRPNSAECRILVQGVRGYEALDMRVWATPFFHHGETFTCFVAVDIADEKRRYFLEKIFLHDILNTASALRGFADLINEAADRAAAKKEFIARISFLSERIMDEINAHRELVAAERNELTVSVQDIDSLELIRESQQTYGYLFHNRKITLDPAAESVSFKGDRTLLCRVIGNMIRNAIEASSPGETVAVGCFRKNGKIHFWVRNPGVMPKDVGQQVFNRFFSTKEAGRGLGTYSMKYLTEKYLGGEISFTSSPEEGTIFTAAYPLVP